MKQPDDQYATLSCAIEALKKKGYTRALTLTENGLFNNSVPLYPSRFITDPFHRCEGPSASADIGVVYAVRSKELGPNGVLVGDCGANAQDFIYKMVSALPAHEPEGRVQPVHPVEHGEDLKA